MAEKTVKSPNPRISVLGVITFILFLICMVPFVLVVINSSKTAKEIIENPIAFPADWGQMIRNVTAIFTDGTIERFEKSYKPDRVLSGTGAGDTSIAAFLKARMDGCPIADCLRYAAATGASCVEAYDALSGLRSFAELDRKIQAGWEKQNFSPLT